MTNREKLVGIMRELSTVFCDCYGEDYLQNNILWLADHLISNGVTVQNWRDAKTDPPKEWRDPNGRLVDFLVHCKGGKVRIGNYLGHAKQWVAIGVPAPVTRWQPLPEPLK